MTESDLDAELRRAATKTAEQIRSEARTEAERITEETDRQIGQRRSELRRDREAEYGAEARAAIAAANHDAMEAILLAQTRVVERVLGRARSLAPKAAESADYAKALSTELREAIEFIGAEGAEVRCTPVLASLVRDVLRDSPATRVRADLDTGTGFAATGADGEVRIDGRLETKIDRLRPALAIEIQAQLGEDERW